MKKRQKEEAGVTVVVATDGGPSAAMAGLDIRTITVTTPNGKHKVKGAQLHYLFAWTERVGSRDYDFVNITHIPSGLVIAHCHDKAFAIKIVEALLAIDFVDWKAIAGDDAVAQWTALYQSFNIEQIGITLLATRGVIRKVGQ